MLIDIITIVLLLLAIFKGLRKGLVVAVFSFVAYFIGLAAALKLSTVMAAYIGSNVEVSQRWLPFLAFFIIFVLVILLVRLGAKAIEAALRMMLLGWLNRLGGVLVYALLYLFIFSILLFYATQMQLIKQQTINASVSYGRIEPLAPKLIEILGTAVPFFRHLFDQLLQFFAKAGGRPQ